MKKITLPLGLLCSLLFLACGQKEEVRTDTVETNTVETVKTEPSDTVVIKHEAADGTDVKINGSGISVDSKNGSNSVDVELKK